MLTDNAHACMLHDLAVCQSRLTDLIDGLTSSAPEVLTAVDDLSGLAILRGTRLRIASIADSLRYSRL